MKPTAPRSRPIVTEILVRWHVGGQGKSGFVVLNVSFVARDPKLTSGRRKYLRKTSRLLLTWARPPKATTQSRQRAAGHTVSLRDFMVFES